MFQLDIPREKSPIMKFSNIAILSTIAISVSALPVPVPLDIFKLFQRRDVLEELPQLTARATIFNSTASNSTNSTGSATGGGNSTNISSSSSSSSDSLPNIKIYSFSDDFTTLFGNDSSSSSSSTLSLNLSTSDLLRVLNIANQGPNGNINATAARIVASSLKEGSSGIGLESLLSNAGVSQWANLTYDEIANVSSADLNSTYLIDLYTQLNDDLANDDIDGAVIVQDAQYLEDTAFFLDLVLNTSKPIVLTKQVTLENLLTEGASNLYDSILVASSEDAQDRGTLVVTQKRIASGFYAKRINTNSLDIVSSNPQGLIGSIYEAKIQWYYDPSDIPTADLSFDLSDQEDLPEVVILQNYQGFSAQIITALKAADVDGVVIGSSQSTDAFSKSVQSAIDDLSSSIPVVLSNYQAGSTISKEDLSSNSTIAAGILDPVKAKLLLQVSLASDFNTTEIKNVFSTVYGG